jgi:hypothetical protein
MEGGRWEGVRGILQFLLAHRTGDVAMMHTGGEKSFSARDRVRDLRGMARVACFTMNANSSHPTTTTHTNQQFVHRFEIQLRQSFIEIVVPALRSWFRSKKGFVRKPHQTENTTRNKNKQTNKLSGGTLARTPAHLLGGLPRHSDDNSLVCLHGTKLFHSGVPRLQETSYVDVRVQKEKELE